MASGTDLAIDAIYCTHCGYDLRLLTGDTCPECGSAIDRAMLHRSQIPWVHRHEIGQLRAIWRTFYAVTFQTRAFCYEIARPVDLADAQRFRRRISLLVYVIVMTLLGFVGIQAARDSAGSWHLFPITLLVPALVIGAAGLWLCIHGATGLHSYWFHPRTLPIEQQNRAVALSHYACAPLAVLPLLTVTLVLGMLLFTVSDFASRYFAWYLSMLLIWTAAILILMSIAAFVYVCLVMAHRTAQRSAIGLLTLALAMPAGSLVLAAITAVSVVFTIYVCILLSVLW